ncbi:MAG: alcohol dehydrogenase catalytic domain-containing protein [Rhodospirillales bacterium]|jgi:L-iditol 2-dehydrogenase/L-gulonate 5-dehydrogenase|nr:alcohol dehydrogenase catalytic domain-containing protein [Rhodospirillales bacterium]
MKAVFVQGPGDLAVVDRDSPSPGAGEAVVRIVAAGICASDVGVFEGFNPIAVYPLTPGHECIGVVETAPEGAAVRPGDRVTVYPSVGCGTCPACLAGRYNHCPTFKVIGISRDGGIFAERVAIPVAQLLPVPDGLGELESALIEPTAVAVHVNRRAAAVLGSRVVVIGTGVIGTLVAQVARAYEASRVVVVDRMESRRSFLADLGFDHFVRADEGPLADGLRAHLEAADVVFDCVCANGTVDAALDLLAPGGKLVMVASPHGEHHLDLPFAKVYRRELSLIASRNYVPDDFREAMRLLAEGAVKTEPLVTGVWPLAEFGAAYADLKAHPDRHLKVLLKP